MPKVNQYCIKHVSVSGLECLSARGATCVVSVVQNTVGTLKSFVSHHKYASVTCYRNCTLEGFSPFLRQHKISYSYIVLNEATGSLLVFGRHSLIFNIGLWWEIGERSSEKGTFSLYMLWSPYFLLTNALIARGAEKHLLLLTICLLTEGNATGLGSVHVCLHVGDSVVKVQFGSFFGSLHMFINIICR